MKLDELLEVEKGSATAQKAKGKVVIACCLAAIVFVAVVIGLFIALKNSYDDRRMLEQQLAEEQKIDVSYVGNKLETISELATAKMTYNGIVHFSEGKILFIDKKEFYMYYRVSLKAGIDLTKAEIQVTEHTVTINLPEVEIYEPAVDETSIQFFDKNFGLFADEEMDDLTEAITKAKEDVMAQPETDGLKETAREQAVTLITALFEGQIGDRELIVNAK